MLEVQYIITVDLQITIPLSTPLLSITVLFFMPEQFIWDQWLTVSWITSHVSTILLELVVLYISLGTVQITRFPTHCLQTTQEMQ